MTETHIYFMSPADLGTPTAGSAPVAFLIGVTLVASIVAAQVREVAFAGVLVPGLVFQGQAWRLFTWVLFEQDPLGLIFAGLALLLAAVGIFLLVANR